MADEIKHGNLAGKRRCARVRDIPKLAGYEWTSERFLRQAIFDSQPRVGSKGYVVPGNGLASAIIRVGRRVLIDLDRFDAWVESHREGD